MNANDTFDREQLEAERSFLLQSLDDLDAERTEGNIDDVNYTRLRDDYTARAARVLHRLDGEPVPADPDAEPPGVSARRRWLVGVGIVAFAVAASIALAYGLGARLPGQTITGRQSDSASAAGAESGIKRLRAAVAASPDNGAAHLELARALMAQQDGAGALTEFGEAARLDPLNPEPFTYSGWLVRLQGFPDQALTLLDKAIAIDDQFADARAFKGIILLRDKHDPEGAIAQFQRYLVRAPDSPLADRVRTLLAEAVEAQPSSTNPSTPTSAPASSTSSSNTTPTRP
ncbi:MAG: tetratricopeptide repeat protein [Acidimicrobiia bacterium]